MKTPLAVLLSAAVLASAAKVHPAAPAADAASGIAWGKDFKKSLAEGRAAGKPLLVDFWAEWCHWCHELDANTYSDPKVAALEDSLTDLAHENALLKRRLFGTRSERSVTSELQLALGDLLASEAKLQADLDASVEKAKDAAPKPESPEGKGKPAPAWPP